MIICNGWYGGLGNNILQIANIIDILSNFVKNPASFTVAKFIDNLTSKHPLLFKETNKDVPDDTGCGPKETNYGVEKNAFKSILMELLYCHFKKYPNSLLVSDVFSLIHWGYALAQGRQLVTTPIICWQRHIVVLNGNGSQYIKHLVNPVFITTVRRFEDSLDSHLFHMTEECSSKQELCELVVNQFIANLCNKKFQAPQYAIKFEDMTVTFQFMRPKNPIIIITAKKQLEIGMVIQRTFLKTNHKVIIIKAKTPIPNTIISFLINVIISSAIIGIPPKCIFPISLND